MARSSKEFNSMDEAGAELRKWLTKDGLEVWRRCVKSSLDFPLRVTSPYMLLYETCTYASTQLETSGLADQVPDAADGGWHITPEEWKLRRV